MFLSRRAPQTAQQRIIVIGAGEVGFRIAQRLSTESRQVVVIDTLPEKLARVRSALDVQVLLGSGANPAVLAEAGVESAGIVLAVTDSDEANLFACLVANRLSPHSAKLARVRDEDYSRVDGLFGPELLNLSALINPDTEVVAAIEHMLILPRALDYAEFGDGRIKVLAVRVLDGELPETPLTSFSAIIRDQGVRVAGILRGEQLLLPRGNDVIHAGDVVYFVCREESLGTVLRITGVRTEPVRRVLVAGGGNLGLKLALRLEQADYQVRLMDADPTRCEVLADKLQRTTVLHGDATDRDFMREENADSMDMVIALTGNEETNVLISLLAKTLGARATITRVNKNGYLPIVRAIGLELSINPRLAATNSIMRFIRRGMVLSTLATQDENVEMLEAVAQEGAPLTGLALREQRLPSGANVLAILRQESVIIPGGDTVPLPGDRVLVICDRTHAGWVENALGQARKQS